MQAHLKRIKKKQVFGAKIDTRGPLFQKNLSFILKKQLLKKTKLNASFVFTLSIPNIFDFATHPLGTEGTVYK